MRGAYTVAEVRAAEDALLARTQPLELMTRAATGLAITCATVLRQAVGKVYGAQVVLLIGSGNNGGDALFAGTNLLGRGASVTAVLCSSTTHGDGLLAFRQAGGRIIEDDAAGVRLIGAAHLVIDGILGIGGHGELTGVAATMAEAATRSDALVVAVDVPSGVESDTGVVAGAAIWADVTVTFGALKPGLHLPPGADHAGLLSLVDIGLTGELPAPRLGMLEAVDVAALLPHPISADHKYSQGVVGVAAGSHAYPGAAVLCVGAALLTKPGLVRYSGSAADDVVRAWPSAIVSEQDATGVGRVQAWAVGPGLGTDDAAREQLNVVLQQDLPTVVDADGLTILATAPELLKKRSAPTVLTPHEGEFARLTQDVDVTADRVGAVRELADRLNCTVLLKGSTTVIADPGGEARLNVTGTPWLATGGTGDVLTGMIAAYLSAGLAPLDAASLAAFVHGIAGRVAADDGPCTSFDVVGAIPEAIRDLSQATTGMAP